jgi:Trk K+ transport system NAD-binding subunit
MARCLIIGCGCRGTALARVLVERGHAVRGTTRDPGRCHAIEVSGAEAVVGDPDRVATLAPALEHVAVACVLLGSASGSASALAALHGPRLEMLLIRMIDSTVRGIVYEAAGRVDPSVLRAGAARVQRVCTDSRIPHVLLGSDPGSHASWLVEAASAVQGLLARD